MWAIDTLEGEKEATADLLSSVYHLDERTLQTKWGHLAKDQNLGRFWSELRSPQDHWIKLNINSRQAITSVRVGLARGQICCRWLDSSRQSDTES